MSSPSKTKETQAPPLNMEGAFDGILECLRDAGDHFFKAFEYLCAGAIRLGLYGCWGAAIVSALQRNPEAATAALLLTTSGHFGEVATGERTLNRIPVLPFIAVAIIWLTTYLKIL